MAATDQIPVFDFSEEALKKLEDEGSTEGWKSLCDGVKEACEEHGCFLVVYDRIPMHLYDEFFMALQSLFDLPKETKEKNSSSLYSTGYLGGSEFPLFQSLGIDDAPQLDATKAFTDLMWPQGNPDACRALHSMAAKMFDLHQLIMKMVFQSLGVGKYLASHVENNHTCLRIMRYDALPPHTPADSAIGLQAHADETIISILGDNEVHGLKVLSKGGDWIQAQPPKGTFLVLVGESLEVLSNGRLQAAKHVVEIAGKRVRYSYGLFTTPTGGTVVEPLSELVDEEHPRRYCPFRFEDYMRCCKLEAFENTAKGYAGV